MIFCHLSKNIFRYHTHTHTRIILLFLFNIIILETKRIFSCVWFNFFPTRPCTTHFGCPKHISMEISGETQQRKSKLSFMFSFFYMLHRNSWGQHPNTYTKLTQPYNAADKKQRDLISLGVVYFSRLNRHFVT